MTQPMPPIDLPHLAGRLFGTPLMIAQPKLDTVLGVLRPRMFGGDRLDAAEAMPEPAPYIVTPSGIAVIPVFGTLVNRTAGLAALSGMTSYQRLAGHLAQAAQDPAVRGLLLDVDSSGGEAGGVFDLADQIVALRGIKPVYALAAEACFSAAYALAGGAERLYVTRTGGVGSVGVVALHLDQSAADAQAGRHYEYVFAGARKVDGNPHAPLSDGARIALQGEVDRLHGLFIAHVARCRGLGEAEVRDQQAALYFGANAVSAGLADQVGTLASVLADLGQRLGTSSSRSSVTVLPKGPSMTDPSAAGATLPAAPPAAHLEADLRQQLAAEIAAATDPADELPAALETRLRAEAAEILEVCQIGGCPAAAADFVRQGLSPVAVRKALLEGCAAQAEATAVVPVSPSAAAGDNPLIAAIKAHHPSRKGP